MARSDTLIEIGQNFRFEQQKKSEIQAQILIFDLSTFHLWLNFQICITWTVVSTTTARGMLEEHRQILWVAVSVSDNKKSSRVISVLLFRSDFLLTVGDFLEQLFVFVEAFFDGCLRT